MKRSSERARIEMLRALFGAPPPSCTVGIGDDAAVLAAEAGQLCWSIDAEVEGVHFTRDLMSLRDAGYRATMAALSDLAAMAARPSGVLAALVLPDDTTDDDLAEIAIGQREAAARSGTAVIGGNLARGGLLSITTTVLGVSPRPLRRSGARPGDEVWLAGPLGWAAAGLRAAQLGKADEAARAVDAFRRPRALIEEGLRAAAAGAVACIDVSDGLATDASRLAGESGVALVLEESALLDPDLERIASGLGRSGLDLVLFGGEDYALVVTAPATEPPAGFSRIGRCETAPAGRVLLRGAGGATREVEPRGFDHFEPTR